MFTLKIFDRKGKELKEGDVVAVSNKENFQFYAEVKYLEEEQTITPFHTFTFHSFEKVDSLPKNAVKSTEKRYGIWFVVNDEAKKDDISDIFEKYLISWRECEIFIKNRCWRITKQNSKNYFPNTDTK